MLMTHLFTNKQQDQISRVWRSCLLRTGLVVKHRSWDEPHLCLGKHVSVGIFWPLVKFIVGKTPIYGLAPIEHATSLKTAPLVFLKDWTVYPTQTVSPLRLFIESKHRVPDSWPKAFWFSIDRPCDLLAHAAKRAFFDLGADMVDRILKHELGVTGSYESDAEQLFAAIKHTLKCTDGEAATILEARVSSEYTQEEEDMLRSAMSENVLEDRPRFCSTL